MSRKILIFLTILCIFLGCGNSNNETLGEPTNSAFRAGEKVELKSVSGAKIALVRQKNGWKIAGSDKTLIFDIFGTYCNSCKKYKPAEY